MLNAFSYSGGFSVYAARGGAKSVTDLDISEHALAAARRNFALNQAAPGVAACRHDCVRADAFEWLAAKPARQFDLIVLDPPKFAPTAAQVQSLQLSSWVQFVENFQSADAPALYNGASVFVLPSHYEGFGFSVLGSPACGREGKGR